MSSIYLYKAHLFALTARVLAAHVPSETVIEVPDMLSPIPSFVLSSEEKNSTCDLYICMFTSFSSLCIASLYYSAFFYLHFCYYFSLYPTIPFFDYTHTAENLSLEYSTIYTHQNDNISFNKEMSTSSSFICSSPVSDSEFLSYYVHNEQLVSPPPSSSPSSSAIKKR